VPLLALANNGAEEMRGKHSAHASRHRTAIVRRRQTFH
jgi:hypothetical protein